MVGHGELYILKNTIVINQLETEKYKLKVGTKETLLENSLPELPGRLIGRTIASGAMYLGSSPSPAALVMNRIKFGGVNRPGASGAMYLGLTCPRERRET